MFLFGDNNGRDRYYRQQQYRQDRYYRRHARRAFRRGGYPLMYPAAYEPTGWMILAAMSRWAFRHRSAFLPFAITAAAFIIAALAHPHHRHWWPAVLAVTAITTLVLAVPHRVIWAHLSMKFTAGMISRAWEACGIDRPAERVYVTTVIAACGGWLTAAIAAGPAVKPLPTIAGIGTVILGIPWWAHRRRRAKVRVIRTMQAWPGLAENMGLPGSRIASATADAWGWTGRIILRKGTTAAHAINQLPAIESGLGIAPGTARALPDPARADRVILRVIETDPHADPIPWREPDSATITRPVDLGLYEDGTAVLVSILRVHVLIAGTTGAGKSAVVNVLTAALAKCADAERWGIDMKGGMELQPWAETLHWLAVTPAQAVALLRRAVALLNDRAARLAASGRRVHEPTPADPAIVVIIDEYAELPAEAQDLADSIGRRGRAVAVTLIMATQRPTQAAMGGGAVRSQADVRICLRVRERGDVNLILGQGAVAAGWDASILTLPGTFLIASPAHTMAQRARARLITDEQVAAHAARYATPRAGADGWPGGPDAGAEPAGPSARATAAPGTDLEPAAPDAALWDALSAAGPDGAAIADLMAATGMGRSWVYYRLAGYARAGRAVQTVRGSWRAVPAGGDPQ